MDSINRNQPEENHRNLSGEQAVRRIKEIVNTAKSCFFVTAHGVRPMAVQKVDDGGNLWFLSASDSHKDEDIAASPVVRLYFQGSPHSHFLYLDGLASLSKDPAKIHELWSPELKTWFTEGEKDPRIDVIKVAPTAGYYWDNKHGNVVSGIKIMVGAAIGVTLDDSIEGTIQP
jgi:general stress protein 26